MIRQRGQGDKGQEGVAQTFCMEYGHRSGMVGAHQGRVSRKRVDTVGHPEVPEMVPRIYRR